MDIKNNLSNHINGQLSNSNKLTDQSPKVDNRPIKPLDSNILDKVSLNSTFKSKKSEELFAKIELEKIRGGSFDKLRDMKAKITEYESAKAVSPEKAQETELGKMLNNPDVWDEIAQKITR